MTKKIAIVHLFNDDEQRKTTNKGYHFFTLLDDLEKDDIVVVQTFNGLRFASFERYLSYSTVAQSFIISKVDKTAVNERVEKDKKIKDIQHQVDVHMHEINRLNERKDDINKNVQSLMAQLDDLQ